MGRWAIYRGISSRLLTRLIEEPDLVLGVLALARAGTGYASDAVLSSASEEVQAEARMVRARFEALRNSDIFAEERARAERGLARLCAENFGPDDFMVEVNIEKRWASLRDLLDELAGAHGEPLGWIVVGGFEVGEDLGYGPVRHLGSEAVATAAAALQLLNRDEVLAPLPEGRTVWSEYDWQALETVRSAYQEAADRGFGILQQFG